MDYRTKKPKPDMLGSGAAAQAGKAVVQTQIKKKKRLDQIMQGMQTSRRSLRRAQ